MKRSIGLALVLVGCTLSCAKERAVVVPPLTTARPPDPATKTTLTGEITAPPTMTREGAESRKGRLVLGWRTVEEQRAVDAGIFDMKTARAMMDRWTPGAEVDLATTPRVPYTIEGAPVDAVPVVVLDVEHTFWLTVFGRGKGLIGHGPSGGGTVPIQPNPKRPTGHEPCAGPRRKLVIVTGQKVGPRRFCAALPASFEQSPKRRYPIVFLLPGFTSTEMSYLSPAKSLAARIDARGDDVVLVGVDTSTPLGSTYFEDGGVNGAYDAFFTKEALPVLERELRGMGGRNARALVGQSTGGYNVLALGFRHSDLFSVIGSSSPDAPDVEAWLFPDGSRAVHPWIVRWAKLEDALGGVGQTRSWAADFSPDPSAPHGFRLPFDLATGAADEAVLAKWIAKSPHGMLRDPQVRARVKKDLSGRIYVSAGRADEFGLFGPAERFAKELGALGIETTWVPTEDGHGNADPRLEAAIAFALERMEKARDVP